MNFIKAYDIGVDKPDISEKIYNNWQEIVDSLASIAGVPSALVMHVLSDKIEVASSSRTQAQENPYEVRASEHLGCGLYCETVMREKAKLHVQNALKDEAWKNNPDVAIDMISYYGLPLLWSDGTVYGTICILDKKDLIPSTTVKELLGLFRKSIENDLEIIEQAHLQEKQKNQLTDLNKNLELKKELIEKENKQVKERLELALMGNKDGIWDLKLTTNEAYFSPKCKEMLGYKDDEFKNEFSDWEKLVHPDDLKALSEAMDDNISQKTEYFESAHRLKHKDNHWVWILARGKTFFDKHDKPIRMTGTHTDVTAEKEVQSSLQESNSLLKKLSDNIPAVIYQYRFDTDGRFSFPYMSVGIEDLHEMTAEDIKNDAQSIFNNVHPDDLSMLMDSIKKSADTMNQWNCEYRINLPKKGLRWLRGIAKPEKLEDGTIFSYGFTEDITDRKNIEIQLEEQHKYLQSIIDGVDDPIMVIKEDYTVELMNNSLQKSIIDKNIADPDNPKCYEISHNRSSPCDGFAYPCPLRDVLETKQHTTVVHNHDTKDGKDRYVELSASPLFDKENNCIGIIESARDITGHLNVQYELREQKSILDYQAHYDTLTELPNRALVNDRIEQAIEKAKRNSSKFALLFIDLDHFKEINDSLGHDIGDEILKTVSKRLREVVRDEDTVARLGGDEFTVLLEELSQVQDVSLIANNILEVLSKSINIDDNILYVSSSIGISIYPDDGELTQNLLKYADSAMYKAKEEGRNNYQYYNSTMTELAFQKVVMKTSLREAIKEEQFVVYYQPQVDGTTDKLIGMEALVRWQHPTMGLVSPDKFIPLAETTGLIVAVDRLVMKIAMTQMTKWYKDGLNPGILAVNLAVKQLQQKDFKEMLENLMKETGCKAEWLALEVTEGQIMTHPDEAIKILSQISDLGIELAVDDFGTGYSSLAYLKRLPIDKLKIDQTFVRDLPDDEEDVGITKAVIALAKSLNLGVIAEGVETKEQKDFLIGNECKNIQGYFYSKPIPADELKLVLLNGFNI